MNTERNPERAFMRKESFGGILGHKDGYGFFVVNDAGFKSIQNLAQGDLKPEATDAASATLLASLREHCLVDSQGRYQGQVVDNGNRVPYLSAPIRVWLEITSQCNLHCINCFNENHQEFKGDMPLQDILHILQNLNTAGIPQITVTGGEPLIRKDVWTILDFATQLGFGLRFFTNGTTINDTNSMRLATYPISHIFASIDGIGVSNDLLRGKGTFSRIATGIEKLAKFNRNVTLSVTLHALSLESIRQTFDFAASIGVRSLLIRPLLEYRPSSDELKIAKNELPAFIRQLELASIATGVEYQLNKFPFFENQKAVFYEDRESDIHFSSITGDNQFGCVAGNTVAGIKSNGLAMACGFMPIKYSTDKSNSAVLHPFIQLWNESENIAFMRKIEANSSCQSCSLLSVCGGGCRANAILAGNTVTGIDPYCFITDSQLLPENKREPRSPFEDQARGSKPWLSKRTITTKCGSGSLL